MIFRHYEGHEPRRDFRTKSSLLWISTLWMPKLGIRAKTESVKSIFTLSTVTFTGSVFGDWRIHKSGRIIFVTQTSPWLTLLLSNFNLTANSILRTSRTDCGATSVTKILQYSKIDLFFNLLAFLNVRIRASFLANSTLTNFFES